MNNYLDKYIKYKTKYNILKLKGGYQFTKDEFINEITKLNDIELINDFLTYNKINIIFDLNNDINQIKKRIIKKYITMLNILPHKKEIIKKYLYIGDSFTRIFDHVKNNEMDVVIYKGKTCSGLNKPNNEILTYIKSKISSNTTCIILNFGNVDIHFSYYYELLSNQSNKKILNISDDIYLLNIDFINKICNNYLNFILELSNFNNDINIYIINPYYSPIETEMLMDTLMTYIFFDLKHHPLHEYDINIKNELFKLENRHSLVNIFYDTMNKLFANLDNSRKIKLININEHILDPQTKKIKMEYLINQDMCDIHLKYNIVVHYKNILNSCGLKINNNDFIDIKHKNKNKYLCPKKLYIGDSLIKIFSHEKKLNETILSYSGMRCMDLLNTNNKIYEDILNNTFSHVILNFGTNDLLLDYFYYYKNNETYTDDFINQICDSYLILLKSLHTDYKIIEIQILIPYYSPISEKYFYETLKRYNKKHIKFEKNETLYTQEFRNNLIDKFESKLKELSRKLEKIKFININNLISTNGYIYEIYKLDDVSDMHFKWNPIINTYISYYKLIKK